MTHHYRTKGVCAAAIHFDIIDDKVTNVKFDGGCHGNTQGIAKLVEGMSPEEVINRLSGIRCRIKNTSCPDQLATALRKAINKE